LYLTWLCPFTYLLQVEINYYTTIIAQKDLMVNLGELRFLF
jgi:hypothetical protein